MYKYFVFQCQCFLTDGIWNLILNLANMCHFDRHVCHWVAYKGILWYHVTGSLPALLNLNTWCRHQMETFSAVLALCAGNSPVTGEFPTQRSVTRSLYVSLICASINSWVNNLRAGDLRRHQAHYDVIVMICDESLLGSPYTFLKMECPVWDVSSTGVQTMHYENNSSLPLDTGKSHITGSYRMA